MGLLDTLIGAMSGQSDTSTATQAPPSGGALSGGLGMLLAQCGGIQGLMQKFSQSGLGDIFASWTGMEKNQPITPDQVHKALGSTQINSLASSMGLDPSSTSGFLAEYLPKIVDKLTPTGEVDPAADDQQSLSALLPSLLASLGNDGSSSRRA